MSGGSNSSQQQTQPAIPPYITPLLQQSAKNWQNLGTAAQGSLSSILNPPTQKIAPLTSGETADIGSLQGIAQGPNINPQEQQAQDLLNSLTSGPIGSSPETLAAMRAYNQNVAPQIANDVALSGGGRGGALAAALSQGQTNAYVPLIQQEIANREAGVGQAASLGEALNTQQQGNLQSALTASGLPREIQQSADTAQYTQQEQALQNVMQALLGPLQLFGGNAFGQNSTTNTTQTPGLFGK